MRVVAEHVETRTRGREQYRIAGTAQCMRVPDRFIHVLRLFYRRTAPRKRLCNKPGVATDQDDGARVVRNGCRERGEILPLAVPPGDERNRTRHAGKGGDGCA